MKRRAIRVCLVIALLLLLGYIFGNVDYQRIKSHKPPLFVVTWMGFFDGGTFVGRGLGYTVISNHGIKYSMEHGAREKANWYWTEGPELHLWFYSFLDRSDLKFSSIKR
jgi:hypothetical protein